MTIELKAKMRTLPTAALNETRAQGLIPAEVYGHGKNQHIFIAAKDYENFCKQATGVTLVNLIVDGQEPLKVLIGEIQHEPISGKVIHLDFKEIKMDEEMSARVPLVFTGVSKVVKEMGGTMIKSLDEVEISCLPDNLIGTIEVDLSVLISFDDVIHVADLKIPENITMVTEATRVVAGVKAKIKKEVLEAMAASGEEAKTAEVAKEGEASAAPVPEENKGETAKSN